MLKGSKNIIIKDKYYRQTVNQRGKRYYIANIKPVSCLVFPDTMGQNGSGS